MNLPKEKEHHFIFGIVVQSQAQKGEANCWNFVFGIMKLTFKELLEKIELHITIVPNFFNADCLFFNLIPGKRKINVKELV